jgi:type IV secretion system protein TrbL
MLLLQSIVILQSLPNPVGGLRRAVGALPDAIANAIFQFVKTLSDAVLNNVINYTIEPLLEVSNPYGSSSAMAAWGDVAEIAVAILPILVVMNLIAHPFDEQDSGSVWELVLRGFAVIIFIGVSRPLFGFAVDATNQVTMALMPSSFSMTFASSSLGTVGSLATLLLTPLIAFLAFLGFLVTMLLLLLRWFLVWVVFVGAPLFAVLWYPNKGPLQSVSKFGSTFLRMGIYSLLAGPVIALVVKVFSLISSGGMITGRPGVSGTVLELGVSLGLVLLMPLLIFLVSYKVIAWAGQPLGVGAVVGATIVMAAAALTAGASLGASSAAAGSSGAGGAGGSAAGSSGSSGARSGAQAGKGGASTGEALDPSAATDGTSIGSGIRQSIGDAISSKRSQSDLEASTPGIGQRASSAAGDFARSGKTGKAGSMVKSAGSAVSSAAESVSSGVRNKAAGAGYHASGNSVVDGLRNMETTATNKAAAHMDNVDFLDEAKEARQIDIQEAATRGLLPEDAQPADHVSSAPVNTIRPEPGESGSDVHKATYRGEDGSFKTVNLSEARASQVEGADKKSTDAKNIASVNKTAQAVGKGSKRVGTAPAKVGARAAKGYGRGLVTASKIGAAAMVGGITQSPYMGIKAGKHIGGAGSGNDSTGLLIGSNTETSSNRPTAGTPKGTKLDEEGEPDFDASDAQF